MSEKLVGVGRSGDMVHASQDMAADKSFKCVSRPWYNKTVALSDGIDSMLDKAKGRDDILCPAKHMRLGLNAADKFILEYIDGREFTPTPHAFRQLATWCDLSHAFVNQMTNPKISTNGKEKYARDKGDAETLLMAFKNGWRRIEPDKQFRFRTYDNSTLRAVLSDRYAIINNVWYIETLIDLFKEIGGDEPRLSHWRGDADTIYGNILLPDTCREDKDSDYGGMLSVGNCEIGTRRLSQLPSVFRAICMNGCIWDQNEGDILRKVHRGEIDLKGLRLDILANINEQIPLLAEGVARFLALKDKVIDKVPLSNIIAMIACENKLSFGVNGQAMELVKQYEQHEANDRNLFGIVNAITRTSQAYENDEWVRLDSVAGSLMNYTDNQWENLKVRAKSIDTKVYNNVFGIVEASAS